MNNYKNIYIKNIANDITNHEINQEVNKYLPFYSDISNDDLAYIFAFLHYKLNDLFEFMNYKLDVNNHFNADESRSLVSVIYTLTELNDELKDTQLNFSINQNYNEQILKCNTFLSESGGSPISDDMKKIKIIKSKPIFNLKKQKTPIDENIIFNETHIQEQWQRAVERKTIDSEGAITIARTLIESILKHILDEQNIQYNSNSELSELYKEVAKSLNLAPEQHQEKIFKQILGGANGIISGLGALRNKLGDAHGKGKSRVKPKERHGELAVNLAGTMAIFLYKTYKEEIGNNG